jgi:ATP-binding cassette subfamily F protein 3
VAALSEYTGTLIFISHDVYFIRALATKVLHIHSGRITPYSGDYDYYLEKSKAGSARAALTAGAPPASGKGANKANPVPRDGRAGEIHRPAPATAKPAHQPAAQHAPQAKAAAPAQTQKERRFVATEARRQLSGQKRKVSDLEARISTLEKEQADLAAELQQPKTYSTPGRSNAINERLRSIVRDIAHTTHLWETEAHRLAQLEADAADAG